MGRRSGTARDAASQPRNVGPVQHREGLTVSALKTEKQMGGFRWYVVQAKRGQEQIAHDRLAAQGFEVYLPVHQPKHRTLGDRPGEKPKARPFIPGYLFVAFDVTEPGWKRIYSTGGVKTLLGSSDGLNPVPHPIPNQWIEALQIRMAPAPEACTFTAGQPLLLVGRTTDFDVIFEQAVDAARVSVLLTLFGRETRQIVPLASVRER